MIHVLEKAIIKATFVNNRTLAVQHNFNILRINPTSIYLRGKSSPLVNDFAENQFRHLYSLYSKVKNFAQGEVSFAFIQQGNCFH